MLAITESLSYEIVLRDESGAIIYKVSGDAMADGMGYAFGDGIWVGAKALLGFSFQPHIVDLELATKQVEDDDPEERDPEDYRGTQ